MDVGILSKETPYPEEPTNTNDLGDLLKFKKRQNIYKTINNTSSPDDEHLMMTVSVRHRTGQKYENEHFDSNLLAMEKFY